jgi:hypothetical protein
MCGNYLVVTTQAEWPTRSRVRHDVHTDGAGLSIRYSCNQWNRTFPVILKTGDQREVHVRFDEALNAEELIYFIM